MKVVMKIPYKVSEHMEEYNKNYGAINLASLLSQLSPICFLLSQPFCSIFHDIPARYVVENITYKHHIQNITSLKKNVQVQCLSLLFVSCS